MKDRSWQVIFHRNNPFSHTNEGSPCDMEILNLPFGSKKNIIFHPESLKFKVSSEVKFNGNWHRRWISLSLFFFPENTVFLTPFIIPRTTNFTAKKNAKMQIGFVMLSIVSTPVSKGWFPYDRGSQIAIRSAIVCDHMETTSTIVCDRDRRR